MKRRNVLLGLGTAAAGSGAVFGSGAFTQISADRDVTLKFADDSNAALALSGSASSISEVSITTDSDGGAETLEVQIGDDGMIGDGVNLFRDIIEVKNNRNSNAIYLNIAALEPDGDLGRAHRLRVIAAIDSTTSDDDTSDLGVINDSQTTTLADKIADGHIVSDSEVRDISLPADDDPSSNSYEPVEGQDDFRYTLRSVGNAYPGGFVELKSGATASLSVEVESGPATGAGSGDEGPYKFPGELRFVGRDPSTFNADLQDEEDVFVKDNFDLG